MRRRVFAVALAAALLAAGCIRLISAEQLEDGSSVLCVRVEPTQDAGPGADAAPSMGPTMRYVPGAYVELP
jgi:hypothetical protein